MTEPDYQPLAPLSTPWTSRRRKLHGWLQEKNPSLAGAYEAAVRLLDTPAFPGRIPIISHVVREICNRLPDLVASIKRDRIEYFDELKTIEKIWPTSILPSAKDYGDTPTIASEDSHVQIPRVAAMAVSTLIEKNHNRMTNRAIVGELFAKVAGANGHERADLEPIVTEFFNTADWFMGRAHLSNEPRQDPEEEELVQRFEQFEGLAHSLIRSVFATKKEIDALLQQANATTD